MKVLLINPETRKYHEYFSSKAYTTFDNGILSIAAVLEGAGHEIQVFDMFVDKRQASDFTNFAPDVVGVSVVSGPNLEGAVQITKQFKELLPGVKVIWGDIHPSVLPGQTLAEPYIDYVAIGAGEFTMLELLDHLQTGNADLSIIAGLGYKEGGQIHINGPRPFIKDLESLPDPAWHLIPVKKYTAVGLTTSRGCVHHCAFCYNKSYNKGYTGFVSAEKIVYWIERLKKGYGVKYFRFNEDNFTFNRKRLREFCRLVIEKRLRIKWSCDSRADLSEADVELMARAGCLSIGLGAESGSQRTLDFMQKDITVAEIERTYWSLVKHKIRTTVYLMYGVPNEVTEDFRASHELLKRLDNPYYMYHRYVPFPGSAWYDYCVKNELVTPPSRLEGWTEFIMKHGHGANLSQVPQEVIEEAVTQWANTYAAQRFKFTLKYNPGYFWVILTNPFKFVGDLIRLRRYQAQVNNYHKTAVNRLSNTISPEILPKPNGG